MAYKSLYRKWRPQTFADVVGQDNIVKTLENSLKNHRISHAYLFAGPRGTGKTTVARLLAKGLNCQTGPTATPCGECAECQAVKAGTSLNVIEIDGASNRGVEHVEELRGQAQFTPINASYKVYIIDEVHMLSKHAFNALLKTLEEPPAHVLFILATTDPHRLPATILSRVQRYDFVRFSEQVVVSHLKMVAEEERFEADPKALQLIAQQATGSMRDALGILEKCAVFADDVSVDTVADILGVAPQEQVDLFTQHIMNKDNSEALEIINELYDQGRDLSHFALGVIAELRQGILTGIVQNEQERIIAIELLSEAVREMRFVRDPRIVLEIAALKIAMGQPATTSFEASSLQDKVQGLEKEVIKLQNKLNKLAMSGSVGTKSGTPKRSAPTTNDKDRSAFVIEVWAEYLKELRNDRLMQCEAFLKEGKPLEVIEDQVIVAFPRDRGFHKASIEQNEHREPAERVLSKIMGMKVRLKCVFQPDSKSPRKQEESTVAIAKEETDNESDEEQKRDMMPSEDFLKASMEAFGGKIISKPKKN